MGRFSNVTDTFTIIVANREWVSSHTNASRLCSSVGWHRNESLCTVSKETTRRALKILRFFHHFSTTRTYLTDNHERERGPIVSVGVDPTGTFWPRLATFDVFDQITIAASRQTLICPSCESPIMPVAHLQPYTQFVCWLILIPAQLCTVILQIFGVVLFSVFSVVNGFTEIKKTPKWEKHLEWSPQHPWTPKFKGSVEWSRHERHFCSLLPYFLLSWLQIFQLCLSFWTSSFDLVLCKNSFRKKKNIRKTTQNTLAPSIFIVLSIVPKLGTPLLHTQAQNTLLQNF